jgi:multiple sugar transport system ATP-binding protein
MASRLVLSKVSKRFGARGPVATAALSRLSLEVHEGELLVLVGPSGCGKSTALRLIAGLDQPSGGRIELDGADLAGTAPQQRDVAMVFQGYALYPHLTAAENIGFPLKMRGTSKREKDERVREVAALVGLLGKLDRLPSELSGGERQRVAMGRAIVRRPKLFLFDEPLSNLDAKLRAELRLELVQLIRRVGVTSIYVTHDQQEAMSMGDRIAVLREGELMQVAEPREIYQRPASRFVAGFIGTPAMNILETASLPAGCSVHDVRGAAVGFRPEHVRLHGGTPDPGLVITGKVCAVERLGAESFVYFDASGTEVRSRLEGFAGPPVGAAVQAEVAREALHWFDPNGTTVTVSA